MRVVWFITQPHLIDRILTHPRRHPPPARRARAPPRRRLPGRFIQPAVRWEGRLKSLFRQVASHYCTIIHQSIPGTAACHIHACALRATMARYESVLCVVSRSMCRTPGVWLLHHEYRDNDGDQHDR